MPLQPTNNTLAILEEARRLINRPYGWVKFTLMHWNPKQEIFAYCVSGACREAAKVNGESEVRAREMLCRTFPEGFSSKMWTPLSVVNDADATRKRDVVAWLDRAIALTKKELGVSP